MNDCLSRRLARVRKEIGNYTAVVRVTKKGIALLSISSRYDQFGNEDEAAEVAAMKRLNKAAAQRKKGDEPNYFG